MYEENATEENRKAKQYSARSFYTSIVSSLVTFIFYIVFYVSGWSQQLVLMITTGIKAYLPALNVYLLIFFLLDALVSSPFSFYRGYILQHQFGQSNENFTGYLTDALKGLVLKLVFFLAILNIIYFLMLARPDTWWIWATAASSILMILFSFIVPVIIIPLFFKLTPLEDEELRQRLESLSQKAGVTVLGIYAIDISKKTKSGNAGLTGFGATKRIILGDTILDSYTPDEIETVIAHELGHYTGNHIIKSIVLQIGFFLVVFFLLNVIMEYLIATTALSAIYDLAGVPLLFAAASLLSLIFLPVMNSLTRRMEYFADKKAVQLTGKKEPFIAALSKLTRQNLGEFDPNPLKEFLFHSHPSTKHRIEYLQKG